MCLGVFAGNFDGYSSVEAMMEAGHWKRIRQLSVNRLKSNPDDAQAHAWLSKVASVYGDLETAVKEGERAVELDGRSAAYHGQLAESYALLADRSSVIKAYGCVRKMKREIDAALSIDPKHIDTLLVQMMFSWKAPSVAGGDKQKSWRIADRIMSVSPVWGHLAQARLFQFDGNPIKTEAALKQAVQADPSFYRARLNLATFYCGERACIAPSTAVRYAQDAIALDPAAAGAYDIIARAYAAEKRWADLETLLSRAERAVPDDLAPYYTAATRMIDAGYDRNRAERYLRRYLEQQPEGREPTLADAQRLLAGLSPHPVNRASE